MCHGDIGGKALEYHALIDLSHTVSCCKKNKSYDYEKLTKVENDSPERDIIEFMDDNGGTSLSLLEAINLFPIDLDSLSEESVYVKVTRFREKISEKY